MPNYTPHAFGAPLTSDEENRPLEELSDALDLLSASGLIDAATTLEAQALAGQKVLDVVSTTGFRVGDSAWVGTPGSGLQEMGVIASISAGVSLTLVANLANTHAIGAPVSRSPAEVVVARATRPTLGTRLDEIAAGAVNVKTHGATGDGTTDDTASLQAAFTAAGTGGTVVIPEGTYKVSVTLDVLSGQRILGTGWGSVLKRANAFNGWVIDIADDATDVVIADLAIDCNRANTIDSFTGGITATRLLRSRLERVKVTQCRPESPAVLIMGGTDNVISSCHFETAGYGVFIAVAANSTDPCDRNTVADSTFKSIDLNGIFFTGSVFSVASTSTPKNNAAIGNVLSGCNDSAIESGIGCRDTMIVGNTITHDVAGTGLTGILVRDNQGAIVSGNSISNIANASAFAGIGIVQHFGSNVNITVGPNTVRASRVGLLVQGAQGVSVNGGLYSGNLSHGVWVRDVSSFQIGGVVCRENNGAGFQLGDGTSSVINGAVMGCLAGDNGFGTLNSQDGFVVQNATGLTLNSLSAYDTRAGGSRTQRYGINIVSGTGVFLGGANRLGSNATAPIIDSTAAAVHLSITASTAATGPVGSVTRKVALFDSAGAFVGWVPVYDSIT
jgi:hypothetical protein